MNQPQLLPPTLDELLSVFREKKKEDGDFTPPSLHIYTMTITSGKIEAHEYAKHTTKIFIDDYIGEDTYLAYTCSLTSSGNGTFNDEYSVTFYSDDSTLETLIADLEAKISKWNARDITIWKDAQDFNSSTSTISSFIHMDEEAYFDSSYRPTPLMSRLWLVLEKCATGEIWYFDDKLFFEEESDKAIALTFLDQSGYCADDTCVPIIKTRSGSTEPSLTKKHLEMLEEIYRRRCDRLPMYPPMPMYPPVRPWGPTWTTDPVLADSSGGIAYNTSLTNLLDAGATGSVLLDKMING